MKKILLFIFPVLLGVCRSQNEHTIDSLLHVLKLAAEDTLKAKILFNLGQEYLNGNTRKAKIYSNELVTLSTKLNYKKGLAGAYSNLAKSYELEGNYPEALKCRFMNLKINVERNDKIAIAKSYHNIATTYGTMGELDKAMEFFMKKISILQGLKIENSNASMANTYNDIGLIYKDKREYDSSLKYLSIAERYANEMHDSVFMADVYINLGIAYDEMPGNDNLALINYKKAQKIAEKINYGNGLPAIYVGIADIYNGMGKYDEAIPYARKGIDFAESGGNRIWIWYGYGSLVRSSEGKKDYKSKSEYLEKYMAVSDSLHNKENIMQLASMRTKFETEEKEKENTILTAKNQVQALQLTQKNYLVYGLSVLFLVAIFSGWLLFRQNKLRSEQKAMQLEQKLLRSQMNPHFIFNSLIAIESFIYKNEPREAGKYLSGFARLMRLILENSREEYISLDKEIKTLEHYLELQKLRFEDKFNYTIEIEEGIDPEAIAIPPMLAQPFIENSIEHGLKNSGEKGQINIRFSRKGNELVFEVKDNGIGLEKSLAIKQEGKKHASLATIITAERLAILNKRKKEKIKVFVEEIKDSFDKVMGTQVSFSIPAREV